MTTPVFDASALLAFVLGEPGADVVDDALTDGGICGAANWSEIAQRVLAHERNWDLVRALLLDSGVEVMSVDAADAEGAAQRWRRGDGHSLADRLCLELADRLDAPVFTADRAWGSDGRVRQIR
ncbi:MAG: PIN domain-containing protein [Acidimicrobiia bacterium]